MSMSNEGWKQGESQETKSAREKYWAPSEQSHKKNDVANSYMASFEAALEQVATVHPSTNLSLMDPCKVVVDGKLIWTT